MADVFSQNVSNVQTYQLGKTLITIPGGENLVCQSATFQYGRQIQPVTPLNADVKYLIIDEGSGIGSLNMILGPSQNVKQFLEDYSNPCGQAKSITLVVDSKCSGNEKTKFTLSGVVISQIQSTFARGQGQNMLMATVHFQFNGLDVS